MQTKNIYIGFGLVAILAILIAAILAISPKINPQKNAVISSSNRQQKILVNPNVGSVAGVDLSELANEANQSASLSAQDSSNDLKNVSSNSQDINSLIK